jgi:hypothetical protein
VKQLHARLPPLRWRAYGLHFTRFIGAIPESLRRCVDTCSCVLQRYYYAAFNTWRSNYRTLY